MSSLHVILDANVLFPASLRELLLNLAVVKLYDVHWQEEILEETRRNLVQKQAVTEEKAARLITTLRSYFSKAMVSEGYKDLETNLTNNLKDRHVLAAAIASGSQIIVTFNVKDFPTIALAPHSIEAMLPDTFLSQMFVTESKEIIEAIQNQAARLKNPPLTVQQVLDNLAKHAPNFVELVRQEMGLS